MKSSELRHIRVNINHHIDVFIVRQTLYHRTYAHPPIQLNIYNTLTFEPHRSCKVFQRVHPNPCMYGTVAYGDV